VAVLRNHAAFQCHARLCCGYSPEQGIVSRWTASFLQSLALLLLVPVGLVLPRYAAGLAYFGGDRTPSLSRFSLAETDRLAAAVAPSGAVIDVGVAPQFNFFWLSNLGGVEFPFQVSEKAWSHLHDVSALAIPQYDKPLPISIVLRSEETRRHPAFSCEPRSSM